jgi:hypothetical protein
LLLIEAAGLLREVSENMPNNMLNNKIGRMLKKVQPILAHAANFNAKVQSKVLMQKSGLDVKDNVKRRELFKAKYQTEIDYISPKQAEDRQITFLFRKDRAKAFCGIDIGSCRMVVPQHAVGLMSKTFGLRRDGTIVEVVRRMATLKLNEGDGLVMYRISYGIRTPVTASGNDPNCIVTSDAAKLTRRALSGVIYPLSQAISFHNDRTLRTKATSRVKFYRASENSYVTQPGDSGSMVLDKDGRLCAIHFFEQGGLCLTRAVKDFFASKLNF